LRRAQKDPKIPPAPPRLSNHAAGGGGNARRGSFPRAPAFALLVLVAFRGSSSLPSGVRALARCVRGSGQGRRGAHAERAHPRGSKLSARGDEGATTRGYARAATIIARLCCVCAGDPEGAVAAVACLWCPAGVAVWVLARRRPRPGVLWLVTRG
jgi:hypothetical protein